MSHRVHHAPRAGVTSTSALRMGLIVLLLLLPTLACAWDGSMTTENGVTIVTNPAKPAEGKAESSPEELWRLGGDSDDEDEFFGLITRVIVSDAGEVYVLDSQLNEIKVYDADGEYLRSIGREGEGPGEFRGPNGMFFLPDGNIAVCQAAPGKIVMLTPDGIPAGDRPVPLPEGAGFAIILGSQSHGGIVNLVLGWNEFEEGKFTQHSALMRINDEGETMHSYLTGDRTLDFANAEIKEKIWDNWVNRWSMSPDGHVLAPETWGEYAISVWDQDGKKERVFGREYEHYKRDAEDLERIRGIYEAFTRQVPNAKMDISDYHQDIFRIYALDNGNVLVNPSRGANDLPDGVIGVFDLFDAEGRYVKEITLKGEGDPTEDGYFFVGNRLFVVTDLLAAAMAAQGGGGAATEEDLESDAEPMGIICYELADNLLGGS